VQDYNQILPNVLFIAQSLGSPTTQAIESQAESQHVVIGTAAQDSAFVVHDINAVIGTPYAVDVANALYYVTQHASGAKVGIIYQNDAYGQDGLKGYNAAKAAYGFDDVGSATYNVTDTSFTSQALAMKNDGAQYVVLTAIPTAAASIIGAAAVIGYHPQWILQGPAWSEYLMTSTGDATGQKTPVYPVMLGQWVMGYEAAWGDTSVAGMSQFLKVQQQYSPTQVPDGYYVYGYCLALMEKDLLQKAIASGDLTRQGVLNAKLHLGAIDFGGLIPNATYTPNLGPADRETTLYQVDAASPGFLKALQPYFSSSAAQNLTFGS
jgi:ABC-type branched-subunit amino acid transport system substrate-binding protein